MSDVAISRISGLNGRHTPPKRQFWLRRLYVVLRKLIRKRQESAAMIQMRRDCDYLVNRANADAVTAAENASKSNAAFSKACQRRIKAAEAAVAQTRKAAADEVAVLASQVAARDQKISELKQQMDRRVGSLETSLLQKERDIKELVDLQIPKLERELKVAEAHIKFLDNLNDRQLTRIEAEIAVENRRITDAEGPAREGAAIRQLLRGDIGVGRSDE